MLALFYGADPVLMTLLAIMSVLAKSYIDAEITAENPFNKIFDYFIASPFFFFLKLFTSLIIVTIVFSYGIQGDPPIDRGIAAVFIVFVIKLIYFSPPTKEKYWHLKGFTTHKYINIAGRIAVAILWILFFSHNLQVIDSILIASLAIFLAGLTFYKTNEGLI